MLPRLLLVAALLSSVVLAGCQHQGDSWGEGPRPIAVFDTSYGEIQVELFGGMAPQTVRNFAELAQDGYYNGTRFHRVIGGFMNQGGDPNTKQPDTSQWGRGGPGYRIVDEFPCNDGTISHQHRGMCQGHDGLAVTHDAAGILSMANSGQAASGGSQFFITVRATPNLDGVHTVFGRVVAGMDVVTEINQVPTTGQPADRPLNDVILHGVRIEGDLPDVQVERL